MTSRDKWQGRQLYPRDTVSQKKLDVVDDRSNRRIDLLKVKLHDLQQQVGGLENDLRLVNTMIGKIMEHIG